VSRDDEIRAELFDHTLNGHAPEVKALTEEGLKLGMDPIDFRAKNTVHDGETVAECAMRELHEELGLEVGATDELGRLDDFDTRSGFTITPIVFWSDARAADLRPSAAEVAVMFLPTTSDLLDAASTAGRGAGFSMRLPGVEVFAPTAAMLYQFAEVALRGREVRVADFYQPPWTHR